MACNICLLFEHKSEVPTHPHLQLLRYILDGMEEQLKQKKKLSPIIPIIIYQGKKRWKVRDLSRYFVKNTELAPAQVREFIEILPKALNKAAMSTYEKIIAEVKTQADNLLAEERQRTAKERQRAEEALQREEEERKRAEEALQREEEERQRATAALQREEEALQREEEEHQRLNRLIYYLHDVMQLPVSNIAEMMGVEAQYVLELLKQGSAEAKG